MRLAPIRVRERGDGKTRIAIKHLSKIAVEYSVLAPVVVTTVLLFTGRLASSHLLILAPRSQVLSCLYWLTWQALNCCFTLKIILSYFVDNNVESNNYSNPEQRLTAEILVSDRMP